MFDRVDRSTGCWLWTGAVSRNGYGSVKVGGRAVSAHRAAYVAAWGPIPPGALVLHSCDRKLCIRPTHLHLGSQADNMREALDRGNHGASGSRREACKRGHPFTPENTYVTKAGHQSCRICRKAGRPGYTGGYLRLRVVSEP